MKNLNSKIEDSNKLITEVFMKYKNPVIMTSFGKDSVVLIDLISRLVNKMPDCICHKEPFFPKKYRFCQLFAEVYGLTVYDFPPLATAIQSKETEKGEEIEILNYYGCSLTDELKTYILPTGIIEPVKDKEFLCGLNDLYLKPTGGMQFKWDCMFIGHKSSDTDIFFDSLELHSDIVDENGLAPDLIYPLRYWTDADIWEYSKQFKIPQNDKRYPLDLLWQMSQGKLNSLDDSSEPEAFFRNQYKDFTFNPDYIETCTLCMSKKQPETVLCPKLNKEVPNVSSKLNYVESQKYKHFG